MLDMILSWSDAGAMLSLQHDTTGIPPKP